MPLIGTELSAYCRERGLFPEQVDRWRQLKQELHRKEKALAEAVAPLIAAKKIQACWGEGGDGRIDRCAG
jgi:hypothetical protein